MSSTYARVSLALIVSLAFVVCRVRADEFDLFWWTVDAGGAMWASGAAFELGGAIGQPDPSLVELSGADYTLSGGFWALPLGPLVARGDMNCDGALNALDINPFVLALTNPAAYYQQFPNCNHLHADIDCNGAVNALDINAFVRCLTDVCPPCP